MLSIFDLQQGLDSGRKNRRIAGRYFHYSSGTCGTDFCLTGKPLPSLSFLWRWGIRLPVNKHLWCMLTSGLPQFIPGCSSSEDSLSLLQLLFSCITYKVFLFLTFSLLPRAVALALDSLPLSSLPQRCSHFEHLGSSQRLWLFCLSFLQKCNKIYINLSTHGPVSLSALWALGAPTFTPGFSTRCKSAHKKETTEMVTPRVGRLYYH